MNRVLLAVTLLGAGSGALQSARAQLTLREALDNADRSAYGNRVAAANSGAQSAAALVPLKGILPSVRIEAGYVRTTDPIGVFGTTLRQRTITQANFDPQRLNFPAPVGNYQSVIVVEQPIFNADAWIGRRAAVRAAEASRATEEWTRLSTRVDVVQAYYGAVLASERVGTLRAAARAAGAHLTQAQSMVRQGMVTKSDALLASVRASDIDATLAEAEGASVNARRQLAVLWGRRESESSQLIELPATLPTSERIRAIAASPRADVRAASRGLDAARADALRARSAYLPHLNSFARYDWNSSVRPYAGDRNWTVGVMASWNIFSGASDVGEVHASDGRAAAAQAQEEAARANAQLDVEQSRTSLDVALTRLSIAERATMQSAEAHRIVGRKYEGGLATVAELLDAQATELQTALALSQAKWGAIAAAADRLRALGLDPVSLTALDDSAAPGEAAPTSPPVNHYEHTLIDSSRTP
ncbi:MAG TPA: TolC family protein [Gemmatimonadaceae bacterium]